MKISITNTAKSIDSSENETLLEACLKNNVSIKNSCGGFGNCTDCKVKIIYGEDNLTELSSEEKKHLGNTFFITKERLACQSYCSGDIGIEILNELNENVAIQSAPKVIKRSAEQRAEKKEEFREPKPRKDRRPRAFNYSEEDE